MIVLGDHEETYTTYMHTCIKYGMNEKARAGRNGGTLTRPERIFVFQFFGGRLKLALCEHQQEISEVHNEHEQRLVPHDHVVHDNDGQRDDGHNIHATIPK